MFSPLILEITGNFPANIRKDIDILVSNFPYDSIWQTIEWQIMLQETRYVKKGFFIGIYENKKLVSYALTEKRDIGVWLQAFFCVWWPIVRDPESLGVLSETIQELAKKEKAVFTQIEPFHEMELPGFREWVYKDFIEKCTAIIDLKQNEEAILARMKPKGRYNIRVAEKAGVEIERVPYTEENLDIFYAILSETLERDKFAANSKEYFRSFLRYLEKYNLWGLFIARRQEESIAAGIFVFHKKTALYYYGASSSDNTKRKYMASYLLQWRAIEEAKKRGCEIFDLLGIADPTDLYSPLAGVTDFKLKLTDEMKKWPKAQIFVIRPFCYSLLRIRKSIKNLKNRMRRI